MPRAIVVTGPTSAGNRLVAAFLVQAGCFGSGSTQQPTDAKAIEEAKAGKPVVVIRHFDSLGGTLQAFKKAGLEMQAVVTMRETWSLANSEVSHGLATSVPQAIEAHQAYMPAMLCELLFRSVRYFILPYEALVLHPFGVVRALLAWLDLPADRLGESLEVDLKEVSPIPFDGNAKWYGSDEPAPVWRAGHRPELVWWPERGMGHVPIVDPLAAYDEAYHAEFVRRASTEIGRSLLSFRLGLVRKYVSAPPLTDIGIGSGAFVEAFSGAKGFDIAPLSIAWLRERGLFLDPYLEDPGTVTLWDSLEHMTHPGLILDRCRGFVFVTIPVFESVEHCRDSHHFKPREHSWYFLRWGFVRWVTARGFEVLEESDEEVRIGRRDVRTFVLRRKRHA